MHNRSGDTNDSLNKRSRALQRSAISKKSVVPALRYRDLGAAIVWLCEAFDFKKSRVLANENGRVIYAELLFGDSMIMLGSMNDQNVGRLLKQPDEIGGAETQTCYLLVDDVDAQYERAKRAGAQFVSVINHDDSEANSFGCRDLEGHIWFFGEHAPRPPKRTRKLTNRQVFAGAALASLVVSAGAWAYVSYLEQTKQQAAGEQKVRSANEQAVKERLLRQSTLNQLDQANRMLTRFRKARDNANDAMIDATARLAAERLARKEADRQLRSLEDRMKAERLARTESDRKLQAVQNRMTAERLARSQANRELQSVERQLKRERGENRATDEKLSKLRLALQAEQARRKSSEERAAAVLERERAARQSADLKAAAALTRIEQLRIEVDQMNAAKNDVSSSADRAEPKPRRPLDKLSKVRAKNSSRAGARRKLRASSRSRKAPLSANSDIRLRVRVR